MAFLCQLIVLYVKLHENVYNIYTILHTFKI